MRSEYDFSKMKGHRNPHAARLKKPVTIRLGDDVIEYSKSMADEMGVPYQNLRLIFICAIVFSRIAKLNGWRIKQVPPLIYSASQN